MVRALVLIWGHVRGPAVFAFSLHLVNMDEDGDNPPFEGVFEFSQIYAGATLGTRAAAVCPHAAQWPQGRRGGGRRVHSRTSMAARRDH